MVWRQPAFLAFILGFTLLTLPLAAAAQQTAKVPRIGVLRATAATDFPQIREAFRSGLREAGYIEGQNVLVEWRFAGGDAEQFPQLAAELVRLNVDVIVTSGAGATLAVRQVSRTVPVVFVAVADPVGSGLVASLARPGGNATGLGFLTPEVNEKRLEFLKEAVPGARRVAVLWNPGNEGHRQQIAQLENAARALRADLLPVEVRRPEDFEDAFSVMAQGQASALMVLVSPLHHRHLQRLVDLALRAKLPAMMEFTEFASAGGLMAYGPSWLDVNRRAGAYVGRILKGTKPADLPVEQPTKFEFVLNLKTAKALGLTIPPSLLLRADQVIE